MLAFNFLAILAVGVSFTAAQLPVLAPPAVLAPPPAPSTSASTATPTTPAAPPIATASLTVVAGVNGCPPGQAPSALMNPGSPNGNNFVCGCVSASGTGTAGGVGGNQCPSCPTGSQPTCVAATGCGCSVPLGPVPSARLRARRAPLVSRQSKRDALSAAHCPGEETACAIGKGWECIDTTSSLDSCGGCMGSGGENCLSITGALGVGCFESKCQVSSCFPGFTLSNGKCIRKKN